MFGRRNDRHNRGRVGSVALAPIWPPTNVPGLVGWWDFQQTFAQSGGNVDSVRNMVSGVDWAEATNKPAVGTLNGRPCMVGDGAAKRIISTEAAVVSAFSGANKALTFICVCQPSVAAQTAALIGSGDSALIANSSWRIGTVVSAPGLWMMAKRGTAATSVNGTTQVPTSPVVVTYRTNGTAADMFINQAVERSGAAFVDQGTPTPNQVGLMCYPVQTPSSFFNGNWGAGLLYNSALSDSQVRGLVRGLRMQWGF